jgi:hypothetical protein
MTSLSERNRSRFDGLRDQALAGIKRTNIAERQASEAGRTGDEQTLADQRAVLRENLKDIDDAEKAFKRSSLTVTEAERRLKGAGDEARGAVVKMDGITKTISAATQLIKLLTSLVTLFP